MNNLIIKNIFKATNISECHLKEEEEIEEEEENVGGEEYKCSKCDYKVI